MNRIPVVSSNIRSVGYDNGVLEIEFNSGGIYQYPDVPRSTYESLMAASSKGGFFSTYIKERYRFIKIR